MKFAKLNDFETQKEILEEAFEEYEKSLQSNCYHHFMPENVCDEMSSQLERVSMCEFCGYIQE